MVAIDVDVRFNKTGILANAMRAAINRGMRKQVFVTEGDVKENIQKYDAIDTGNMLGSVRGEIVDQTTGLVSVSAESEKGFAYPWIVNYGGVYVAPRPFFTEAELKARDEFAGRVKREIEGSV